MPAVGFSFRVNLFMRCPAVMFVAALAAALAASRAPAQPIPAFPGAEGAGAASLGGRGGDLYFVTSLADTNTLGTLRHGITTAGTTGRTILFRTGGQINLTSNLSISNPRITIAGQSAPGDGITLAVRQTSINDNDVVLRNIRFRPGNSSGAEVDALSVEYAKNVMIDHVSASWSVDEVLSVTNSANVSVQWSAITEALKNAGHSSGAHSYGSLINGNEISFHHNYYADNDSRNPRPQIASSGTYNGGTVVITGGTFNFDFRNNVIYNWGDQNGYNGAEPGLMRINYVGNFSIAGPATPADRASRAFDVDVTPTQMYLADNLIDSNRNGVISGSNTGAGMIVSGPGGPTYLGAPAGNTSFVSTQPAAAALTSVLDYGGARYWNRDAVDTRVFAQPLTFTGTFIDSPSQVGGYPTLSAGTAPTDTDNDGMPNTWETSLGLDPFVANNNGDYDSDGYTDIEEYLNELAAWPAPLPAVFTTGSSGRFALWSNWDTRWQPSRFDTARIASGTSVVDAVGQYAGTIQIGTTAAAGPAPVLAVTSGGLSVSSELAIGAGSVNHTAGIVTTATVTLGSGSLAGPSTYTLAGGLLQAEAIQAVSGTSPRTLAWTSGTIQNLDSASDLLISGSGGLTLALSGSSAKTFAIESGRTATVAATITGSGGRITKAGGGTLLLSGSAAGFSGGVLFDGGELMLGSSSPVGTGTLDVTASGTLSSLAVTVSLPGPVALAPGTTLTLSGSGNATFSGQIANGGTSGAGSLVIASTGTTTLAASNAYTGTTTLQGGGTVVLGHNLAFGPSGAVTTRPLASSTITLRASTDLTGVPNLLTLGDSSALTVFTGSNGIVLAGGLRLSGGSRQLQNLIAGKALELSGTTVLGLPGSGSPRTLTVSGSGTTLFSGPIVNGGSSGTSHLTLTNSGTTILAGLNTFSGTTGVSNGTLVVNGRLGSGTVAIAANARLMGSGTIQGPVTVNGVLSPGNSPGLLTVGSLLLGGASSTLMELSGTARGSTYDGITITNPSGLTYGGTLTLAFGSLFPTGTTLDLFSFSGTAAGDLTSLVATGSYGSLTFTRAADLWTSSAGGQTLEFSETTGRLAITAVVPEPGTLAILAGAALVAVFGRFCPVVRLRR